MRSGETPSGRCLCLRSCRAVAVCRLLLQFAAAVCSSHQSLSSRPEHHAFVSCDAQWRGPLWPFACAFALAVPFAVAVAVCSCSLQCSCSCSSHQSPVISTGASRFLFLVMRSGETPVFAVAFCSCFCICFCFCFCSCSRSSHQTLSSRPKRPRPCFLCDAQWRDLQLQPNKLFHVEQFRSSPRFALPNPRTIRYPKASALGS